MFEVVGAAAFFAWAMATNRAQEGIDIGPPPMDPARAIKLLSPKQIAAINGPVVTEGVPRPGPTPAPVVTSVFVPNPGFTVGEGIYQAVIERDPSSAYLSYNLPTGTVVPKSWKLEHDLHLAYVWYVTPA